ncbi:MAG: ACT domain-containing protein [Thermoplasmatales archaeon]|nr:ACT domain-containing protein [Thermoplasmatales archaeon]
MWGRVSEYFRKYPAQEKIANLLMEYGLKVKPDGIYCGEIKIPDQAVAGAVGGDRRMVSAAVNTILRNPKLKQIFSKLLPTAHLKDIAPDLGWGVLDVAIGSETDRPGLLSSIAALIAESNVNIKQVIVEDVDAPVVHIVIITETPMPGDSIHKIKAVKGVKSVTIY